MIEYYYAKDIANLFNIDIKTIAGQIKRGKIPKPVTVIKNHLRHRRWNKDEIDIWMANHLTSM